MVKTNRKRGIQTIMEKVKSKKTLLAGGMVVLIIAALMVGLNFFSGSSQATGGSLQPDNLVQPGASPLNAKQDGDETSGSDTDGGDVDMHTYDIRMRWNGERWEYSTDGGQTWTDTPPDGVKVDENGDLTMWQGEGDIEDFDPDAHMQEVDDMINSIESGIDERYGDSIARKVDGVWEFSSDDGATWTNEPPEGIEVSEDGTRFRIGGGEGDIDNFDADSSLEE